MTIEGKFLKDLSGQRFGRLVVLDFAGVTKHRLSKWRCLCDCGNEKVVTSGNLKTGTTSSCGCYNLELIHERNVTHGMTKTKEFMCWQDILKRCNGNTAKHQKDYTERGIGIHPDFEDDFAKFYEEIGPVPSEPGKWSVGRIDNNIGYTYGNLRWELPPQQARNKTRYANNTTGVAGVSRIQSLRKDGTVYEAFVAQCKELNGKTTTRTFNICSLGEDEALRMAAEWRKQQIERLNEQGAGYGATHGSDK